MWWTREGIQLPRGCRLATRTELVLNHPVPALVTTPRHTPRRRRAAADQASFHQLLEAFSAHGTHCSWEGVGNATTQKGAAGMSLRLQWHNPAFVPHPLHGHEVFYYGYGTHGSYFDDTLPGVKCFSERPFHNRLGDGREVTTAELTALGDAFRHAAARFEWQAGDVLCLDNFSFGHGRDPYTGNREVLASMGNTVHWGAGSANN